MNIDITEESLDMLAEYATIPIAFEVRHILDPTSMTERAVDTPYMKDYDALQGPTDWPGRFDIARWGILAARIDGQRVGGAAIAVDGRPGVAVLWDLRVAPRFRGQGVGATLFRAAEQWVMRKGRSRLEVETQDINVPACRFYARMGCELTAINPHAYAELPNEVQLIWTKQLPLG